MGKISVSIRLDQSLYEDIEKLMTPDKDRTEVMVELLEGGLLWHGARIEKTLLSEDTLTSVARDILVSWNTQLNGALKRFLETAKCEDLVAIVAIPLASILLVG